MSPIASIGTAARRQARLRLVHGAGQSGRAAAEPFERSGAHSSGAEERSGAHSSGAEERSHVLIAGADAGRRAKMLAELRALLPAGTPFVEAKETWEVLARTTGSRMVVLTGDLSDISAQSLMRVLSRRYPMLPVVAVGRRTCAAAPGVAGAALV